MIRGAMLPLLALENMALTDRRLIGRAFDLYVTTRLSFADAYHAALAERTGGEIVSFDRGFDRIPGIKRIEP
jgi:predicted nucleic acid-binding protein